MKKIFTTTLVLFGIFTSPTLSAQSLNPVKNTLSGDFEFIISKYTQSNKGYLVLSDYDNDNGSTDFKIYDENLNEIKSITINGLVEDDLYSEVYLRELEYNPDAPK